MNQDCRKLYIGGSQYNPYGTYQTHHTALLLTTNQNMLHSIVVQCVKKVLNSVNSSGGVVTNLNISAALTRCMVEKNQSADRTFPPPTHCERRGQSSSSLFFYSNLWLDVVFIRTPFVCCSISPPPFISKLYFLCSLAIWICLRYV